ncbi:hypothetical protein P3S68_032558 [Capsicum galapagoense]
MIIDTLAGNLIDKLTGTALVNGGYASMHLNGVYGLAQCWKTLSNKGCRECLDKASKDFKGCFSSRDARALIAGCYLRYSTQNFVNNLSADSRKNLSLSSSDWQCCCFLNSGFLDFSEMGLVENIIRSCFSLL